MTTGPEYDNCDFSPMEDDSLEEQDENDPDKDLWDLEDIDGDSSSTKDINGALWTFSMMVQSLRYAIRNHRDSNKGEYSTIDIDLYKILPETKEE